MESTGMGSCDRFEPIPDLRKATMGVYPFMFGVVTDFEPVVQEIVKVRPERRADTVS